MKRVLILLMLSIVLYSLSGCEMALLLFGTGPQREYKEHKPHNQSRGTVSNVIK